MQPVRDRAVDRLIDYVGQAADTESLIVVGLMQGLRSDEPDGSKANDRIAEGLRRVCRVAEQLGVSLVIEPVNHLQVGFNHTVAEASALADRVGSPSLGVMLDTFHMNIEERSVVDGNSAPRPARPACSPLRDQRRAVRHGRARFPSVLSALDEAGYDRVVSLKVYRGCGWEEAARSSAEFLRGLGYGHFVGQRGEHA